MNELWKVIPWYDKYCISNTGRVKSNWFGKEKFLKPFIDSLWYYRIDLRNGNKRKTFLLHRLIATAFIPNPLNYNEINHKDGNTSNNKITNLERCTHSENMFHAHNVLHIHKAQTWKWKYWKDHNRSKIVWQYSLEGILIKVRDSIADIQRNLWFKKQNISSVCKWKINSSYWYMRSFISSPTTC